MGCPSEVYIGESLIFSICTHDPDTGILTDADAEPIYRVYEDETATVLLSGTMSKLDDANTTGFYSESIACTIANGFEISKTYTIYIQATVDSDTGGISYGFKGRQPAGVPKGVAFSNFEFLLINSTDHTTPQTGMTVSIAKISKDGAAYADLTNSVSEVGLGTYKINLTAAEVNADSFTLYFSATGADARLITIKTSS